MFGDAVMAAVYLAALEKDFFEKIKKSIAFLLGI